MQKERETSQLYFRVNRSSQWSCSQKFHSVDSTDTVSSNGWKHSFAVARTVMSLGFILCPPCGVDAQMTVKISLDDHITRDILYMTHWSVVRNKIIAAESDRYPSTAEYSASWKHIDLFRFSPHSFVKYKQTALCCPVEQSRVQMIVWPARSVTFGRIS